MIRTVIIAVGLLMVLAVTNGLIAHKEHVTRSGTSLLLKLAPVDPRSLIQGDYMVLAYEIARGPAAEAVRKGPSRGRLVITRGPDGVGTACESVASDSITPRRNGSRSACTVARTASNGRSAARRANSESAGRRKISGRSAASAPSLMNSRYICAGEIPFASAAATKLPDETPT